MRVDELERILKETMRRKEHTERVKVFFEETEKIPHKANFLLEIESIYNGLSAKLDEEEKFPAVRYLQGRKRQMKILKKLPKAIDMRLESLNKKADDLKRQIEKKNGTRRS